MTDAERRAALRDRASALVREADALRKLADDMYPLTDDEELDRRIEEDDEALWGLLLRVWDQVYSHPGISAEMISKNMGLPNDYPSEGSNYFTLQILNYLESFEMVQSYRGAKPYEWTVPAWRRQRPERPG